MIAIALMTCSLVYSVFNFPPTFVILQIVCWLAVVLNNLAHAKKMFVIQKMFEEVDEEARQRRIHDLNPHK